MGSSTLSSRYLWDLYILQTSRIQILRMGWAGTLAPMLMLTNHAINIFVAKPFVQ